MRYIKIYWFFNCCRIHYQEKMEPTLNIRLDLPEKFAIFT